MLVRFGFHHKCTPRVMFQKLYITLLKTEKKFRYACSFWEPQSFHSKRESEAVPMSLDVL